MCKYIYRFIYIDIYRFTEHVYVSVDIFMHTDTHMCICILHCLMQGQGSSKLDQVKAQVKEFSIDTFRTTKQLFSEMMGKGTRTVDPKVDGEC